MCDVFISHVEEDSDSALELAISLEEAGYRTWCYEVDILPGRLYLDQVGQAIDGCQVILLLISPRSLGSHQVTNEVVRAFEDNKHLLPLLRDITDADFKRRQPVWRQCVGAATSISLPPEGTSAIIDRVVNGLKSMGVIPSSKPDATRIHERRRVLDELRAGLPRILEKGIEEVYQPKPAKEVKQNNRIRLMLIAVGSVMVIAVIVVGVIWLSGGFGRQLVGTEPTPTPTATGAVVGKGELLFSDDFDDNLSGWALDHVLMQTFLDGGELHLMCKEAGTTRASHPAFTTPSGEFAFQAEATKRGGPDIALYGLVFGRKIDNDFYHFGITGNGFYRLLKWSEEQWELIIPYTFSSYIDPGDSTNNLEVICTTSEVELYVNGRYLETVSVEHNMRGGIGLIVCIEDLYVSFDHVRVYSLIQ